MIKSLEGITSKRLKVIIKLLTVPVNKIVNIIVNILI